MAETILFLVVAVAIGVWFFAFRNAAPDQQTQQHPQPMPGPLAAQTSRAPAPTKESPPPQDAWLLERWSLADKHSESDPGIFPPWYFDPVSERQLERLAREGVKATASLSKGKASDLIGLGQPVRPDDSEALRFFKRNPKGMSETQGLHEVAKILADPEMRAKWGNRPPSAVQKEFFGWFNIPIPKGLTSPAAKEAIATAVLKLTDEQSEIWEGFEELIEGLADKEWRADYGIKKVPWPVVRDAARLVKDAVEGTEEAVNFVDHVIDKIIEMRPDLELLE